MASIRILPEVLSNRIAAGEVVERPASVVKELVENSIDAKATDITIEVEKSGKTLIRVSDNGTGLSRAEALLSIERYATSKISTQEDLFTINTMGFRGEALPSIASVSKFAMITKTRDSNTGTRIEIVGGKLRDVSDTGAPVGTMIEIRQLFFNIPARKKFLKTDQTEIGHIVDSINGLALGHPEIRFRLFSNASLLKNYPASDKPFLRTVSVLGNEVSKKLNKINYTDDNLSIRGFCAEPSLTRGSASGIYLFVNRRLIHDRGLISAIFQAYRGRIMKGKYPLLVLYIDIDANEVDVNVHPAKREVRFYNARKIYEAVSLAIGSSFTSDRKEDSRKEQDREQQYRQAPLIFTMPDINEEEGKSSFPSLLDPEDRGKNSLPDEQIKFHTEFSTLEQRKSGLSSEPSKIEEVVESWDISEQTGAPKILGQVMGTYIVAETDAGLLLIDQHAAHERIVYESLKKKIASSKQSGPLTGPMTGQLVGPLIGQGLLVPEIVEFNHRESGILQEMIPDLALLGIIVEPFGGTSFAIKSIPSIICEKDIKSILIDIIEKTLAEKHSFSKDRWLDECIISMACRQSIRARHKMNNPEMQTLLQDLEKCDNPRQCPHGRPTMIVVSRKELEKWFKRITN
jgi:DNA mismatch repair protein MutL